MLSTHLADINCAFESDTDLQRECRAATRQVIETLREHLDSDIPITTLIHERALSALITFLWDIGLEIGHSTRTIDECVGEATRDITVITNLIESRHLAGPTRLLETLQQRIQPDQFWPSAAFFKAKENEQLERHLKYHDAAYNLEPNVKEGPEIS